MRCCLLVALSVATGLIPAEYSYPPTYKGPVIGILTQKTNNKMRKLGHIGTYIAASYVRYLEMAGLK